MYMASFYIETKCDFSFQYAISSKFNYCFKYWTYLRVENTKRGLYYSLNLLMNQLPSNIEFKKPRNMILSTLLLKTIIFL